MIKNSLCSKLKESNLKFKFNFFDDLTHGERGGCEDRRKGLALSGCESSRRVREREGSSRNTPRRKSASISSSRVAHPYFTNAARGGSASHKSADVRKKKKKKRKHRNGGWESRAG
ncbi:hypothetical protein ANTRET_LOCUS6660 [Anthophora retusa]